MIRRLLAWLVAPRSRKRAVLASGREVHSYEAAVTVGPVTAAKLSKILGREVRAGEVFNLGTIAHPDRGQVAAHVFSDPRLHS